MNRQSQPIRTERLYLRLTADEAERVAALAGARGLTVSDFARRALLRGTGVARLTGRRALSTESASLIRQLSAIAIELRRLLVVAETGGTVCEAELRECLARLKTAIGEVAA